jgi:hypothetical protein
MIIVAGVAGVVIVVLIVGLLVRERDHDRVTTQLHVAQQVERDQWTLERSELLTRIQRPDLVPRRAAPVRQRPPEDRHAPELHKVGRVVTAIPADPEPESDE